VSKLFSSVILFLICFAINIKFSFLDIFVKLKEISEYSVSTLGPKAIGYLCGPGKGLSTLMLRAVMSDQSLSIDANYLIEEGSLATFPIFASDLPSLSGPSLGQRLKLLKSTWLATELKKSKEELLKQ